MEADASQSHAGKKVNSYSTEFKLEAVRFAVECSSNYQAAKKFNVDRKRIREWRANQSKLESASCKRKRLAGAGRKPFDLDIEEMLLEWVHERRSNGFRVSRKMIRSKARFLNIHGKHWVGAEVHDQTWVMHTAQDNGIPKGSRKTN